jgi:hypothetical protein
MAPIKMKIQRDLENHETRCPIFGILVSFDHMSSFLYNSKCKG